MGRRGMAGWPAGRLAGPATPGGSPPSHPCVTVGSMQNSTALALCGVAFTSLAAFAIKLRMEDDEPTSLYVVPAPAAALGPGATAGTVGAAQGNPADAASEVPSCGPCGLRLERDKLVVESWDRWMEYAPPLFLEAVGQGLATSEEILAHVMQQAFPALRWPPAEDSPYFSTWSKLAEAVDRHLPKVAADGSPVLRLI